MQLSLLIKLKMVNELLGLINKKLFNKIKKSLGEDVEKTFNVIEKDIEKYFKSTNANVAHSILINNIWDKCKHLEDKSQETELMQIIYLKQQDKTK